MGLEAENTQPEVKWAHENNAAKPGYSSSVLWTAREYLLQEEEGESSDRQYKPNIEVEEKVLDVEMPWFGTVNFRAFSRAAEDVVEDDIQRDNHRLLVEKPRYNEFKKLG